MLFIDLLWSQGHSMGTCWSEVAFRASLRFEKPCLFLDCRQPFASVCVCMQGGRSALLVSSKGGVLGRWGRWGEMLLCCTCAPEPQDWRGGHLKVSPFKEPSRLAAARRNKGVKLEALSPPSQITPDRPVLALPPPPPLCCSALHSHCQTRPGRLLAF